MSQKKVVILGASGFVGTTLTERLLNRSGIEVVPAIHSAASAWRLARHGIPLQQLDINDRDALSAMLRGATHVINCTRGPRSVMIDGLRNVIAGCRAAGVTRLVHLSSVMVYGDPPDPASHHEDAPTNPPPGPDSYGLIKLEQDRLVQKAAAAGLASVVLCPPNISGPHSEYLAGIVNSMRSGSFALVDDGGNPCNLVDVRNLCHAIELALDFEGTALDGTRLFVTDGQPVTWMDVFTELRELAEVHEVRRIEHQELARLAGGRAAPVTMSISKAIRHLVSSDVRAALRKDPLLASLDRAARRAVSMFGGRMEDRLRMGIEGHTSVLQVDPNADLAVGLCAQQLRGVRHLNDRAEKTLGFRPPVTFKQSMRDFRCWYRNTHGMDSPYWLLSRHLYT